MRKGNIYIDLEKGIVFQVQKKEKETYWVKYLFASKEHKDYGSALILRRSYFQRCCRVYDIWKKSVVR